MEAYRSQICCPIVANFFQYLQDSVTHPTLQTKRESDSESARNASELQCAIARLSWLSRIFRLTMNNAA